MRVLVTGTSGIVGSKVFDYLSSKGETVTRFKRDEFSWKDNINLLSEFDCIIHAAANTNVETCELEHNSCYKDNTLLTERLAIAAGQANCKFVYISSTGIYGSGKLDEPYHEYDDVEPTTHHHRSKWLGETAVNKYTNNGLILRTGWIFGGKPELLKNFVSRRIEEAIISDSSEMQSNNQQIGVPTFVDDFVSKLYELLMNNESGTFNVVNQGKASRCEYVSKIMEIAKLNVIVVPADAKTFNRKALVSNNESAITLKLEQLGYCQLPHWKDSLEHYINVDLKSWLNGKLIQ